MNSNKHLKHARPSARGRGPRAQAPYRAQAGSVALEYVLVSTFATVVGVALLGLAGSIFKQKVDRVLEKISVDTEEIEFNIFDDLP